MRSRLIAITLGTLGLCLGACASKDDNQPLDPGVTVDMPPVTRGVVDAGLVVLDMDADVYGPGGGAGLNIPDAGLRPDGTSASDAAVDLGGAGAACELLATNTCATGDGCYPKSGGGGSCQQAGFLPGGSKCDQSSPDSRCILGYNCVNWICTGLCHVDGPNIATECKDSMGSTCVPIKDAAGDPTEIGYCVSN
jgi:hypothetical protein